MFFMAAKCDGTQINFATNLALESNHVRDRHVGELQVRLEQRHVSEPLVTNVALVVSVVNKLVAVQPQPLKIKESHFAGDTDVNARGHVGERMRLVHRHLLVAHITRGPGVHVQHVRIQLVVVHKSLAADGTVVGVISRLHWMNHLVVLRQSEVTLELHLATRATQNHRRIVELFVVLHLLSIVKLHLADLASEIVKRICLGYENGVNIFWMVRCVDVFQMHPVGCLFTESLITNWTVVR